MNIFFNEITLRIKLNATPEKVLPSPPFFFLINTGIEKEKNHRYKICFNNASMRAIIFTHTHVERAKIWRNSSRTLNGYNVSFANEHCIEPEARKRNASCEYAASCNFPRYILVQLPLVICPSNNAARRVFASARKRRFSPHENISFEKLIHSPFSLTQ